MKFAYTVSLLVMGIVPILLQFPQSDGIGRIESSYDREADLTTVQCDLVQLGKGAPKLIVQANASFRGKEPNETARFWLGLSSYRGRATRHTRPLFKETTMVSLFIDSTRLEFPVKDYHSDFYELNRLFAEEARADIGRDDLRKLLDAERVEGRWGDVDFKLSDAALKTLKEFISHQVFAGNSR